jgi:hypothetical protein
MIRIIFVRKKERNYTDQHMMLSLVLLRIISHFSGARIAVEILSGFVQNVIRSSQRLQKLNTGVNSMR